MTVQSITLTPAPYSGTFTPGDTSVTFRFFHRVAQVTILAVAETGDTITYSGTDADTAKAGQQRNLSSSDSTVTVTCTPSEGSATTVTVTLAQDADPATEIGDVLGDIPGLGTVSEAEVVASGAPTGNNTTFSTIMTGAYTDLDTGRQYTTWETLARFTAESSSTQRATAEDRRQRLMTEAASALAGAQKDGKYTCLSATARRADSWASTSFAEAVIEVRNSQPLVP